MPALQFRQLSDQALFVQFGTTIDVKTHQQIQQAITLLQKQPFPGLLEIVPGYTNFCIYYDPFTVHKCFQQNERTTSAEKVQHYIKTLLENRQQQFSLKGRLIEIPVHYGGEYGPDLNEVANSNGLTPAEVIAIHTSKEYLVHMLGFAPGFPFLGGMDKKIATPRRSTPRLEIAAGSVGIAGGQTGIYPLSTPGGWQIIGRTMTPLFLQDQNPPTLLQTGDRIRFVAVKEETSC